MAQTTDKLRRRARHLYAQGAEVPEIADIVGRSAKTVYRWRKNDRADWDELRSQAEAHDPHAMLAELLSMRQDIVEQAQAKDAEPSAFTDSLWKLQRIIQSIRDEIGDLSTVLGVLEGFAEWSRQHADEDEREVLRRLTRRYLAELREEHTS